MVVPGGGLSPDGSKWIACRPRYFLTVEVCVVPPELFLQMLVAAHHAGHLQFFGIIYRLADKALRSRPDPRPLREIDWVVYAKEPFAGPKQVLRYLSRYTHRIAISNRRLRRPPTTTASPSNTSMEFRIEGPARYKTMTLTTDEFIRVFPDPRAAKGLPSHPTLWACSVTPTEPKTSSTHASCSPCRLAQNNPRRPKQRSTNPTCCRIHVRAAGAV